MLGLTWSVTRQSIACTPQFWSEITTTRDCGPRLYDSMWWISRNRNIQCCKHRQDPPKSFLARNLHAIMILTITDQVTSKKTRYDELIRCSWPRWSKPSTQSWSYDPILTYPRDALRQRKVDFVPSQTRSNVAQSVHEWIIPQLHREEAPDRNYFCSHTSMGVLRVYLSGYMEWIWFWTLRIQCLCCPLPWTQCKDVHRTLCSHTAYHSVQTIERTADWMDTLPMTACRG